MAFVRFCVHAPLHHGLSAASCARDLVLGPSYGLLYLLDLFGHLTLGHLTLGPALGPLTGCVSIRLETAVWAPPRAGDRSAPARAALAGRSATRRTPRGCDRGARGASRFGAPSGPRACRAPGGSRGRTAHGCAARAAVGPAAWAA